VTNASSSVSGDPLPTAVRHSSQPAKTYYLFTYYILLHCKYKKARHRYLAFCYVFRATCFV